MDYTKNYHLPQWVKSDRIMMEDFNQMCTDIESGIDTARAEAKQAAELPYVVGSYVGDSAKTRDIAVGFRPRFVIICSSAQRTGTSGNAGNGLALLGPTCDHGRIHMTDDGFQLDTSDNSFTFPRVNDINIRYDYIAFR